MSHGWAKASACRLQVSLSCAILCHIVSLQYLSRSSLYRLAGLPRLFLSLWSPSGDTRGPSVVFEAVDVPCPGLLNFSHITDYVYEFSPLSLSDPVVGPSVMLSILLSIFVFTKRGVSLIVTFWLRHSDR